jgi:hypothetical protein
LREHVLALHTTWPQRYIEKINIMTREMFGLWVGVCFSLMYIYIMSCLIVHIKFYVLSQLLYIGCVLYELATGRHAFDGTTLNQLGRSDAPYFSFTVYSPLSVYVFNLFATSMYKFYESISSI